MSKPTEPPWPRVIVSRETLVELFCRANSLLNLLRIDIDDIKPSELCALRVGYQKAQALCDRLSDIAATAPEEIHHV